MRERICFPYKDDLQNIQEFADAIETIHNRMMDPLSEMIFSNRLLFSLTENHKYMKIYCCKPREEKICITYFWLMIVPSISMEQA